VINATLGARFILPGSYRSGGFHSTAFYAQHQSAKLFPYLASYAHTRLRPVHGPNRTRLAAFFADYFALPGNSPKRLRSLAMLREPTDLRASNYAMAMCSLNGKVNNVNWDRGQRGLEPICTPAEGLNISRFVDGMVEKAMAKCAGEIKRTAPKLDKYEKILCRRGREAMDFCRGPSQLLRSAQYNFGMRSMLRGLMGRFVAREPMGRHDYRSAENHLKGIGLGFSTAEVEEYTLIDLGGLDPNLTNAARDTGRSDSTDAIPVEPDFLWFGITERMAESTCLFFHAVSARPLAKIPRARVVDCKPTSWWTEAHRDEVRRREPADYAVWRTANAILDARVWKMKADVRARLEDKRGLSLEEQARYAAFVEAGCV